MSIRIHNSLTKKQEELKPLQGKTINMYSCGVTVYDECHIGHARSLYVFDVIRRHLKYRGFKVNFVRNITDIDDKIINKANELNKDWKDVVKENIAAYENDLKALEIEKTDKEPRATENIESIKEDIAGLIQKGFAYEVDGDVYFSVRKFEGYGKLSGQSIEKMQEAVRIEKDEKKQDPLDFALWKRSKEDEPFWDSPWGKGRPGWHIECSSMSLKYLNCETLDIHAGGRDLIFPHHENEIAQAEALSGKPFAKYWIHHGLLTINGQKMAKSSGNFITIHDALEKYTVEDLKMFFLSSHYASPIDFSDEKMQEAHKALQRFEIFFNETERLKRKGGGISSPQKDFIKRHEDAFVEAMDDDFNTPRALGCLFELINEAYRQKDDKDFFLIAHSVQETVKDLGQQIFGLFKADFDVKDNEIQELLNQRQEARAHKDFKRSDGLRDVLMEKGIVVEDTKDGQSWRRA